MDITLSLSSDELDHEELQQLTRRLCSDLRNEAGVDASLVTQESAPGAKGDLAVWGQIVMTLIGSGGAVVTAIKVLEAYAKKNRTTKITAKTAKGEITIDLENSKADVMSLLKTFLTDDQAK